MSKKQSIASWAIIFLVALSSCEAFHLSNKTRLDFDTYNIWTKPVGQNHFDTSHIAISINNSSKKAKVIYKVSHPFMKKHIVDNKIQYVECFRYKTTKKVLGQYVICNNASFIVNVSDSIKIYSFESLDTIVLSKSLYLFKNASYYYTQIDTDIYVPNVGYRNCGIFKLQHVGHDNSHDWGFEGIQIIDKKLFLPLYTKIDYLSIRKQLIQVCTSVSNL